MKARHPATHLQVIGIMLIPIGVGLLIALGSGAANGNYDHKFNSALSHYVESTASAIVWPIKEVVKARGWNGPERRNSIHIDSWKVNRNAYDPRATFK